MPAQSIWRGILVVSLLAGLTYGAVIVASRLTAHPGREDEQPTEPSCCRNTKRPELALGRSSVYDYDPPEPGRYHLPVLETAGDGRVLDLQGKVRRLKEVLKGRITVLSFIYTRCADPSACPLATSVLSEIHSISKQDAAIAENLQLVTFSFDPEHDTPRVLADYSQLLRQDEGSDWLFLTTPGRKDLEPILEAYGQRVERKKDADDPLGPLYHTLRVYLIDRRGMVRNIYSSGLLDPRLVVTDVRTLLLEKEPHEGTLE